MPPGKVRGLLWSDFGRTSGPKPGTVACTFLDGEVNQWQKLHFSLENLEDQDQEFTFNELGVQRFVKKKAFSREQFVFFPFFASVLPIFLRTCLQHSNFIHHDIVGESLEEYQTSAARIASKRAYSSATTAGAWKNLGPGKGRGYSPYCTDSNSHF